MKRLIAALLLALACAPVAVAHEGSPNFLSEIEGVRPALDGLQLEMLNRDDRIELENRTGKDIVILGYDDEPYARIKADGTVEVNTNSKAHYLNEDRFGTTELPETLPSEPKWEVQSKTGRFEWHDHRAHYMGKGRPPQVKDPDKRQKVFDWEVPMQAGGTPATITGTLFWTPQESGSTALYIGAGVLCVLMIAGALVIRRRRSQSGDGAAEAW